MKILAVPNSLHSELASCVSIELGICGPYHVLASGCAAGLGCRRHGRHADAAGSC